MEASVYDCQSIAIDKDKQEDNLYQSKEAEGKGNLLWGQIIG